MTIETFENTHWRLGLICHVNGFRCSVSGVDFENYELLVRFPDYSLDVVSYKDVDMS